jgi:hypothetical protein
MARVRSTVRNSACSTSAARDTSGWNAATATSGAYARHRETRRAGAGAERCRAHARGVEQQLPAVAVIAAAAAKLVNEPTAPAPAGVGSARIILALSSCAEERAA